MYTNINQQLVFLNNKFYCVRKMHDLNDFLKKKQLIGLNLKIKGRIKGIQRAKHLQYMQGKLKMQTITFPMQTKQTNIQTK